MLYEDIFRMLSERKVEYVVVGGIAAVLHGVPRSTMDLDLMVHLKEENVLNFVEGMTLLGYVPRVPVKAEEFADPDKRKIWEKEKEMKVFSFYDPKSVMKLIDVFVNEPIEYQTIDKNKIEMRIEGISIFVISREELKQLKRLSGREKDLDDIDALEQLEKLEKEKKEDS